MLLSLSGLPDVGFDDACRLAENFGVPAVVADEKFIIRYKNRAVSEQLDVIRRGTALNKYLSKSALSYLEAMRPGEIKSVSVLDRISYSTVAVKGKDNVIILFNAISSELCELVIETYAGFSGYDQALYAGRLAPENKRADRSGAETRMRRHLADIMGIIAGGLEKEEISLFNAADITRSVISAADGFVTAHGGAIKGTPVPAEMLTVGSSRSFAAIMAIITANAAKLSLSGRIEFSGGVTDNALEFVISVVTGEDPARLEQFCSSVIRRDQLKTDPDGLTLDVYLMRLLASGSVWELEIGHSPVATGEKLSFTLRCPAADGETERHYSLSDVLPLDVSALVAMEMEIFE